MPTIQLSPKQQAALEKFERDGQAARDAITLRDTTLAELDAVQAQADASVQAALDTHEVALASAQAFVDSILSPDPEPPMPPAPTPDPAPTPEPQPPPSARQLRGR